LIVRFTAGFENPRAKQAAEKLDIREKSTLAGALERV